VSHSDALLLCAVTTGRDIGVDVEAVKPISEMDGIARQSFAAEDQAKLRAAADSEKRALFFRLWTRREAIAKCSGVGIAHSATNEPFGGAVVELETAPGFVGALAVASGGIELRIDQVVSPRAR
jgi:4'-phosphopantetheinyl transferase